MIYHDGRSWKPCLYIARFKSRGEWAEKPVADKEYWEDMVYQHDHLSDLSFEPLEFTEEQDERLQEVQHIGQSFGTICTKYVEDGEFPEGYDHPLGILKIKKEQEQQNRDIADAFYEIMMSGVE